MERETVNPRLLLVEDDPVSQHFLADAARALPADVACAGTLAEAVDSASSQAFDGWLIDAHLPDGSGIELLARLRREAVISDAFALAHTASRDVDALQRLHDAGFAHVVSKPLSIEAWQRTLREALAVASSAMPEVWNDKKALRALNGSAQSVTALRALFVGELAEQQCRVSAAIETGDIEAATNALHRLKASCGFVGAEALGVAVAALHRDPHSMSAREAFKRAVHDVLERSAG